MEKIDFKKLVENPGTLCVFDGEYSSLVKNITENSSLTLIEIDCRECVDEKTLFSNFSDKLKFPDYFGNNWDALHECVRDLDWLDTDYVILFLNYSDELLKNQKDKIKMVAGIIESTIKDSIEHKSQDEEFSEPEISIIIGKQDKDNCLIDEINKIKSDISIKILDN